jgi:hypothetical protein
VSLEERNHRLAHCTGFAVFGPGGRIGAVSELWYGSRRDRPDFFVVRRGLFRRRTMSIPVEQVVEIDTQARKVVLHGAPVGRIRGRPGEALERVAAGPRCATPATRG